MKEFNPMCLSGEETFAVNNRNQLMPCCLVDNFGLLDEQVQTLLEASDIDKYENIEQITKTQEWQDFFNMLIKAKRKQRLNTIPRACKESCTREQIRQENWQD